MSRTEVKFAGFGGQGIVLSGFILGRAVSIFEDRHAVLTQSYGPEARGGAARSEVIISDEKIGYPRPLGVDLFVAIAQQAFDTYKGDIRDDTVVIIDPDLVPRHDIGRPIYKVRAQKIAEEVGHKVVTNITMLGAVAGIYNIPSTDAMREAVRDSVPAKFLDLNMKAFERGLEAVKDARPE